MISDLSAHGHLSLVLWACNERKGNEQGHGPSDCVVRPISKVPPAPSSAVSQEQPLTNGIGPLLRDQGKKHGEWGNSKPNNTACPQSKVVHGRPGIPVCPALYCLPCSLQRSSGGDCAILSACLPVFLLSILLVATSVPMLCSCLQFSSQEALICHHVFTCICHPLQAGSP